MREIRFVTARGKYFLDKRKYFAWVGGRVEALELSNQNLDNIELFSQTRARDLQGSFHTIRQCHDSQTNRTNESFTALNHSVLSVQGRLRLPPATIDWKTHSRYFAFSLHVIRCPANEKIDSWVRRNWTHLFFRWLVWLESTNCLCFELCESFGDDWASVGGWVLGRFSNWMLWALRAPEEEIWGEISCLNGFVWNLLDMSEIWRKLSYDSCLKKLFASYKIDCDYNSLIRGLG